MIIALKDIGKIEKKVKTCGIYKITSPTNKIYIGQSVDMYNRYCSYKNLKRTQRQYALHNSFKKHGIENHMFEIIEECSRIELNRRERYWQDYYNVSSREGLNCALTGTEDKELVFKKPRKTRGGLKVINITNNIIYNSIKEASVKENISEPLLRAYLNGVCTNATDLILKSDFDKGLKPDEIFTGNKNCRKVIDINTKKVYNSIKEACIDLNLGYYRVVKYLNRVSTNKTNLMFLEEFEKGMPLFLKEKKVKPIKKSRGDKKVMDADKKIIYPSIRKAAKSMNKSPKGLTYMLEGKGKNDTSLIYYSDYKKGKKPNELYKTVYRYINIKTNKKYEVLREAAKDLNINRSTLYGYIYNKMWDKTDIRDLIQK